MSSLFKDWAVDKAIDNAMEKAENLKAQGTILDDDEIDILTTLEFDRLMEISPPITEKVIKRFKNEFCDESSPNYDPDLKKPEICGALETTKHSVFKEKEAILDTATAAFSQVLQKISIQEKEKMW